MFSIFNRNSKDSQKLFDFLAEMEKNLEIFYVMDQRQFITQGFLVDCWPVVQGLEIVRRHESIGKYAAAMLDFNASLKAYKDFEAWYTGDVHNKKPENGRKLHAMKNELDQKLRGMEALIIPAGQDLEREMLKMGLLKS